MVEPPRRICERKGCGKPLPAGSARQRRFCTERCQVREWRRVRDEAAATEVGK